MSEVAAEIDITLQPKQLEFYEMLLEASATWFCFGGSFGGAKSYLADAIQILELLKPENAGETGLIFMRLWKDLWDNHVEPIMSHWPIMADWWDTSHQQFNFPNGSILKMGYAANKGEIQKKFKGKAYFLICVDQSEEFSQKEMVFLKARARSILQSKKRCKIILFPNPGYEGHAFVKRVFMDGPKDHSLYHENERPDDYVFLQARGWDNVEWSRAELEADGLTEFDYYEWTDKQRFEYFVTRSDYGRNLMAQPEDQRKGNLMGDWDWFAGQYFSNLDARKHRYVARAAGNELQPWWPRWLSIDWGRDHPSAVYWHCVDEVGGCRTYREFVKRGMTPTQLGMEIAERSHGEKIAKVYLSPDAFRKVQDENTIAIQIGAALKAANKDFPLPVEAANDRIGGWMLMYQMLDAGMWAISDECPELWAGLGRLTRDQDNREDCLKQDADEQGEGGDDAADSARYGLYSYFGKARVPLEKRVADRLAVIMSRPDAPDPALKPHVIARLIAREKRVEAPLRMYRRGPGR